MAWVEQIFTLDGRYRVHLYDESVRISEDMHGSFVDINPINREEAHSLALMLRRAARRLEDIGKGLE